VIDYLCLVSSLTDDGFSPTDAEEALLLNDGEEKRARKFIKVGLASIPPSSQTCPFRDKIILLK
jgi:hypothetical protein